MQYASITIAERLNLTDYLAVGEQLGSSRSDWRRLDFERNGSTHRPPASGTTWRWMSVVRAWIARVSSVFD